MKLIFSIALFSVGCFFGSAAVAGPKAEALATCLADSTSGKDRKTLATWMFFAMSVHPELKGISNVSQQTRDDADRAVAALLGRLLAEQCARETRDANAEGGQSLLAAFESLGGLAMQELMANDEVTKAIGGFERYVDMKKLESVLIKKE